MLVNFVGDARLGSVVELELHRGVAGGLVAVGAIAHKAGAPHLAHGAVEADVEAQVLILAQQRRPQVLTEDVEGIVVAALVALHEVRLRMVDFVVLKHRVG